MRTIEFDDSTWPVVRITYAAQVNEDEFEELLGRITATQDRALREGQRIALIYDATSGYSASARIRKRQAEWIEQNKHKTRAACAGLAFVFDSVVVRGVLTAILWMSEMHAPHKVFATIEAAEAWARGQTGDAPAIQPRLGS